MLTRVDREGRPTADRQLPRLLRAVNQIIEHLEQQLDVVGLVKPMTSALDQHYLDVAVAEMLGQLDGAVVRNVIILHAVQESNWTLPQLTACVVLEQTAVLLDIVRKLLRHEKREVWRCYVEGLLQFAALLSLGTE